MDRDQLLKLGPLNKLTDVTLLVLRLFVGVFLMLETWDNIESSERMAEFVAFMTHFGFPSPELLAPLSVWAQFICGALLVLGLFTRWAALVMVFNFIVAFLMVHMSDDLRTQFPALILIFVSIHIAATGAGRLSIDQLLFKPAAR